MIAVGTKEEKSEMVDRLTYDLISAEDIGFAYEQYDALQQLIEWYSCIEKSREHIVGDDEYAP